MILRSSFDDFYDWAIHTWRDPAVRFEREQDEPEDIRLSNPVCAGFKGAFWSVRSGIWGGRQSAHDLQWVAVSIAGQTPIPLARTRSHKDLESRREHETPWVYFALPDADEVCVDHLKAEGIHLSLPSVIEGGHWLFGSKRERRLQAVRTWAAHIQGIDFSRVHAHAETPLVMCGYGPSVRRGDDGMLRIWRNPRLCDMGLAPLLDPVAMAQDMARWLGAFQHPEDPPVSIPDKNLLEQKGFDPIYGFRKTPEQPG